jgi:hypothetical protein
LRYTLAVTAVSTLAVASGVGAQEEPLLLSTEVELADYGLEHVEDVRRGRVSLVHDPDGPRIALHFLRSTSGTGLPGIQPDQRDRLETGSDDRPEVRALWVWSTAEILADEAERADFLDFVADQAIERVFLHVPAAEGEAPSAGYVPFDGDALAPLLAALHARGALTYALDGDPNYVRPENHAGVLRTVRRVVEHNRSRPPEERFHGVRYDIEPYLLPGFQGPRRQQILDQYVRLIAALAEVAHEGGLRVGADVPFWLDGPDEETGQPFEAELEGVRWGVLRHVMATVDDVAVMAYRTTAEGPNGVLRGAGHEIVLGNGLDRADVFVGVETTRIPDEELHTFRGRPRAGLPTLPDARWVVAEELERGRVRISLVEGAEALAVLARRAADTNRLRHWFAGQPLPLPGDMLSFHSLGADAMRSVTDEIVRRFRAQSSFLGLAFHDYRGLRALLEGS